MCASPYSEDRGRTRRESRLALRRAPVCTMTKHGLRVSTRRTSVTGPRVMTRAAIARGSRSGGIAVLCVNPQPRKRNRQPKKRKRQPTEHAADEDEEVSNLPDACHHGAATDESSSGISGGTAADDGSGRVVRCKCPFLEVACLVRRIGASRHRSRHGALTSSSRTSCRDGDSRRQWCSWPSPHSSPRSAGKPPAHRRRCVKRASTLPG